MFWLSPIGPERRPGFEYSDYRKEVFALAQCNPLDCRKRLSILRSSASSVRACSSPPSCSDRLACCPRSWRSPRKCEISECARTSLRPPAYPASVRPGRPQPYDYCGSDYLLMELVKSRALERNIALLFGYAHEDAQAGGETELRLPHLRTRGYAQRCENARDAKRETGESHRNRGRKFGAVVNVVLDNHPQNQARYGKIAR
jgi:hypothetical protein